MQQARMPWFDAVHSEDSCTAGRPPLQNRPGGPGIEAHRLTGANCVTPRRQSWTGPAHSSRRLRGV